LSKFDIEVRYVPGKTQVVADAMYRWAYPASKAMQDCSWHGSEHDSGEMKEIIRKELEEEREMRVVGMIYPLIQKQKRVLFVLLPGDQDWSDLSKSCSVLSIEEESELSQSDV